MPPIRPLLPLLIGLLLSAPLHADKGGKWAKEDRRQESAGSYRKMERTRHRDESNERRGKHGKRDEDEEHNGRGEGREKGKEHSGKGKQGKVTLCHKGNTITVSQHAAEAHYKHGDRRGPCGGDGPSILPFFK